jgi:hypothetical protein
MNLNYHTFIYYRTLFCKSYNKEYMVSWYIVKKTGQSSGPPPLAPAVSLNAPGSSLKGLILFFYLF